MVEVELDPNDITIIEMLLKDARTSLKDIAEVCGVSSNAIFKHIENLKSKEVIVGSTALFDPKFLGQGYVASLEVTTDYLSEGKVAEFLKEHPNVLMCFEGIGRFNIFALIGANCIGELDSVKEEVRLQPGVRKVIVAMRVDEFEFLYQNLDLSSTRDD